MHVNFIIYFFLSNGWFNSLCWTIPTWIISMEPKPVNLKTREWFQFHALKTYTYLVYSERYNLQQYYYCLFTKWNSYSVRLVQFWSWWYNVSILQPILKPWRNCSGISRKMNMHEAILNMHYCCILVLFIAGNGSWSGSFSIWR